jgi:hypothetical protein
MQRLLSPTVRLRLTMLYGGLFFLSGLVLLAISYLFFRDAAGVNLIVPTGSSARTNGPDAETELRFQEAVTRSTDALHQGLLRAVIVLAIMTLISIALGWLVAGRVLRPLRSMTATTRQMSGSRSRGPATSCGTSPTPSTVCSHGSRRTLPNSSGSPPTPRMSCAPRWRLRRPSSTSPTAIRKATTAS